MLAGLADETVLDILKCVGIWELGQVVCVSRSWRGNTVGEREFVWRWLAMSLGPLPCRSSRRRFPRHRRSALNEFGRLVEVRRSNAEELLAKYERIRPSLSSLRKLLAEHNPVDVNYRGSDSCSLLHHVVADPRLSKCVTLRCVRELVEMHGADPKLANDKDFSPIMSAAALGDAKVVAYLLDKVDLTARGSHPNGFVGAPVRPGQEARTAAQWAELYGHSDVVDMLDRAHRPQRKRRKVLYCRPSCFYERKNAGEMVCCGRCDNWLHCECVGMDMLIFRQLVRDTKATYTCPDCLLKQANKQRQDMENAAAAPAAHAATDTAAAAHTPADIVVASNSELVVPKLRSLPSTPLEADTANSAPFAFLINSPPASFEAPPSFNASGMMPPPRLGEFTNPHLCFSPQVCFPSAVHESSTDTTLLGSSSHSASLSTNSAGSTSFLCLRAPFFR